MIDKDNAREMQRRSVDARKRNKLIYPMASEYQIVIGENGVPDMADLLKKILSGDFGEELRQKYIGTLLDSYIDNSNSAQKALFSQYFRSVGRSDLEDYL